MPNTNFQLGRLGEENVCAHLKRNGYDIVERNFRNRLGEVDLIARDGQHLCFIEIKTRRSSQYGSPLDSITASKKSSIIRMAESYLKYKGIDDQQVRFDVIGIIVENDQVQSMDHVKNAFEAR